MLNIIRLFCKHVGFCYISKEFKLDSEYVCVYPLCKHHLLLACTLCHVVCVCVCMCVVDGACVRCAIQSHPWYCHRITEARVVVYITHPDGVMYVCLFIQLSFCYSHTLQGVYSSGMCPLVFTPHIVHAHVVTMFLCLCVLWQSFSFPQSSLN